MTLRDTNLDRLDGAEVDVLIVGGGINGAVSAAALASRGASVILVDRGDFAGFTSQESSNLVWGGFKYLENYELALVRKLCRSRNRLRRAYPSNITPIGFLAALDRSAPHPPWLAGLGAMAYWAIGDFATRPPQLYGARSVARREPIVDTTSLRGALEYHDAYLNDNDARFVFGFVRAALDVGAIAANYVEVVGLERAAQRWRATLVDRETGAVSHCTARALVNAAGPFADGLNEQLGLRTDHRLVFSKGIHLVVPQLTANHRVLAFFDDTQRLFYAIPMGRRTVIGTTDTRVDDPYSHVTDEDRDFLLDQLNARLRLDEPLRRSDVIAERCGVRPLVVSRGSGDQEDRSWTSLSRRHELELDRARDVITIFGGKLTDCLNVGVEVAEAIEELGVRLDRDRHDWYGEPGGDTRREFYRQARLMKLDGIRHKPGVEPLSDRLWRRYGRRAFAMLETIREDPAMGGDIMDSADYLRAELHHAAHAEMITRLDDFLRRRSKISLVVHDRDVRASAGLREVAEILFGADADAKLVEHFGEVPPSARSTAATA